MKVLNWSKTSKGRRSEVTVSIVPEQVSQTVSVRVTDVEGDSEERKHLSLFMSRDEAARMRSELDKALSFLDASSPSPTSLRPVVEPVLIQDMRHKGDFVLWWRANGQGYTFNLDEAGRYSSGLVSRSTDREIPESVAKRIGFRVSSVEVLNRSMAELKGKEGEEN